MEVKKPITYDQQIVELQSKGFIVTDPDICKQRLEQIRYYRLLAYLLPFKNPTTKKYRPGIPIERVFKIYEFDGKIRALISKTIDDIEIYMRSILSYYYGHRYGALGYLANSIGIDKSQLSSWLYCLTGLRNSCAHYSRLYFTKFPAVPAMPTNFSYQTIPPSKIFDQLIPLRMTYPDRKKWNLNFIIELESIVDKYSSYIELGHIGFPEHWKTVLKFD